MTNRNERVMAQLNLVAEICRAMPEAKIYEVTRSVYDLAKIAKSLHKRYENACNYQWANTEAYERRTENLEKKAQAIGESLGVIVGHQRDPRGWPLVVRSGSYETRLA